MDLRRTYLYANSLRIETKNLEGEILKTQQKLYSLERKIRLNKQRELLLKDINEKIFDSVLKGETSIVMFLDLSSRHVIVEEVRELVYTTLSEVGLTGLSVETIDQFKIRNPECCIHDNKCDTILSFEIPFLTEI